MKKLFILLLMILGLFVVTGCNETEKPKDPVIPEVKPEPDKEDPNTEEPDYGRPEGSTEFKVLDLEYNGPKLDDKWFELDAYWKDGVDHEGNFEFQGTGYAFEVELIVPVDGDTAHFEVPSELKLYTNTSFRFLNVDTEETQREQEVWGKPASNYTKDKLLNAYSIVIQNDPNEAIYDIYNRNLGWIWVKDDINSEYELLNYNLINQGLARTAYLWGAGETMSYEDKTYTEWMLYAEEQSKLHKRGYHGNYYDPYWDYINNCPNDKWNLRYYA